MKKKIFKWSTLLLSFSILSSVTVPVITYANELETYNEVQVENFEDEELPEVLDENLNIDSITDFISEQVVDDNKIEFTDDGVFIDGKFYTPDEFDKILETMEDPTEVEIELTGNPEGNPQSRAFYIPAVGYATTWVYTVPGVGQVAIVATAAVAAAYGSYIFSKAVIKSGHWAYNKIKKHVNARPRPKTKTTTSYNYQKSVSKQDYISYNYGIPKRLLDSNGNVKLKDMNQKINGKNAYKDPKTGYIKEKDTAGHGGRKWKIKDKNGKRKASTDGNGKILSK